MVGENAGPESDAQPPFARFLDMFPGESADGVGTATMRIRDHHLQESGVVQGGLIVTLVDYAFYRAVKSRLRPGERSVTVELKVNFIAPAANGELTATARVVSGGGLVVVVEGEVTDDRQVLIARGLSTFLVLQPRP